MFVMVVKKICCEDLIVVGDFVLGDPVVVEFILGDLTVGDPVLGELCMSSPKGFVAGDLWFGAPGVMFC